jgi:hypothetical protein
MADGTTKPIEKVKEGDRVLSRDPKSGKIASKKVESVKVRQVPGTLVLHLSNGERIETTKEHPFYVVGEGFVPAGQLGIGTSIVTRAGPSVQVTKVERHDASATVYNFTVEGTHTYFVGTANGGLWVHNTCGFERHHVFPQAADLAERFSRQGINIHDYTLELETDLHRAIPAGGPRGGAWNQAWRDFFEANEDAQAEDIYRHAGKLIYDFGIDGRPLVPYR